METIWKVISCFVALLSLELCCGLPIGQDLPYQDGHTQFLTGLIAVLLTVCGVVCLAGCLCCQRRNGFKEFRDSPVVVSVASQLDHGHVNPIANGEFTIFTPLSTTSQSSVPPTSNIFSAHQPIISRTIDDYKDGDIDVSDWYGSGNIDFPRAKLKYIQEVGKGWFGRVVEGTAQGVLPEDESTWTPVTVRILEATATNKQRIIFLHDASIYKCPPHPNILQLLGRSLENVPLLLLQEHCENGDLKGYLKKQQLSKDKFLTSKWPLQWYKQLTSALKHLHSNKLIHPDLAARNCRLTHDLTLKLGDYGCGANDYPEDYYNGSENVPVRWCAPECVTCTTTTIQTKKVTQAGNIWSLGICFWEIEECAARPYESLTDDEVVSQVFGPPYVRLTKPKSIASHAEHLYSLMQLCWALPQSRPTANQIEEMLENIDSNDFNSRWEQMKPNIVIRPVDEENDLTNITVLNMGLNVDDGQDGKYLSASMHILAGSLDNLLEGNKSLDSWAEEDEQYVKLHFELGPLEKVQSSGSETEDENWKRKIELGLYTEKVRQKSRSVADLMVLTHIDCSESDSETPLPSLGYKNVRCHNLENSSLIFGSEGNLLNVHTTFEEELKKLKEERRDSLLFVPDKVELPTTGGVYDTPESRRLLEDLNNTSTLEPQAQFFNVYNVVAISSKYSPMRINYNNDLPSVSLPDVVLNAIPSKIPKLSEIIENNISVTPVSETYKICDDLANDHDCQIKDIKIEASDTIENDSNVSEIKNVVIDPCAIISHKINGDADDILNLIPIEEIPKISETFIAEAINYELLNATKAEQAVQELSIDFSNCKNGDNAVVNLKEDELNYKSSEDEFSENSANSNCLECMEIINKEEAQCVKDSIVKLVKQDVIENIENEDINILHENQSEVLELREIAAVFIEDIINSANDISLQRQIANDQIESKFETLGGIIKKDDNKTEPPSGQLDLLLDVADENTIDSKVDLLSDSVNLDYTNECDKDDLRDPVNQSECVHSEVGKIDDGFMNDMLKYVEEYLQSSDQLNDIEHPYRNLTDDDKLNKIVENFESFENDEPSSTEKIHQNEDNLEMRSENITNENTKKFPNDINIICDEKKDIVSLEEIGFDLRLENEDSVSKSSGDVLEEVRLKDTQLCQEAIVNESEEINDLHTEEKHLKINRDLRFSPEKDKDISLSTKKSSIIIKTQDFLNQEILNYSFQNKEKKDYVNFDLSNSQEEIKNSQFMFLKSSTPYKREGSASTVILGASDDFSIDYYAGLKTTTVAASPTQDDCTFVHRKNDNLKYSLETWDNFLGKSFDEQQDRYTSDEPQSLLFLDDSIKSLANDGTYVQEDAGKTFTKQAEPVELKDIHFEVDDAEDDESSLPRTYDNWDGETSSGWFLHPQSNGDDLSGQLDISQDDSYVRFSMDDEVMAAIRNELLTKLPQAQRSAVDLKMDDVGEYETTDRNEVFIKYNVYNTPLSPIPEESHSELLHSGQSTPHCTINTDLDDSDSNDSDWSEGVSTGQHSLIEDECESPRMSPSSTNKEGGNNMQHRHTPSQESCCSNDTLFNLEELQCNEDNAKKQNVNIECETNSTFCVDTNCDTIINKLDIQFKDESEADKQDLMMVEEEQLQLDFVLKVDNTNCRGETIPSVPVESSSSSETYLTVSDSLCYTLQNVAPLNSPEDRPWKHIEASLTNAGIREGEKENEKIPEDNFYENMKEIPKSNIMVQQTEIYDYIEKGECVPSYVDEIIAKEDIDATTYINCDTTISPISYVNCDPAVGSTTYVNCNPIVGESKGYVNCTETEHEYESVYEPVYDYCPLADIRFSGPSDSQMMTTSFSDSADLADERDWDSGSDTRSSSSGEFIWKEGSHEASVKALHAAPQDNNQDELEKCEEDSSSCSSEEDGDGPEFVPSAWDKYATPTKSALRSPEKTMDKTEQTHTERKCRGVSFKKQKYHCVYEYPREPDSPIIQNYDVWTTPKYPEDWEVEAFRDIKTSSPSTTQNLYQTTNVPDFIGSSMLEDDFYISSSAKPFDVFGNNSQFFPGKDGSCEWGDLIKSNDNVTPDSGAEDVTTAAKEYTKRSMVLPLKTLSQMAVNRNKSCKNIGGLRHTRDKLKLDLPPSPSAFTKGFTMEPPPVDPIIGGRQVPTFSTFGKSRFVVQHVDTPPNDENTKNVSFEALPYKPLDTSFKDVKTVVESVRGEASLLDSADEDSGIESCTLERRKSVS